MRSSFFMACLLFGQVRFLKSASRFLAKVSANLVRAFSPGSFFLAKQFLAKSVFSIGFSKSSALAFCKFKVDSVGKVGLVKNYGACKIKSQKAWFCF